MSINQLLRFEPILKEKIWGGEKLKDLLDKKSTKKDIGESWEISNVDENISLVCNRNLKGKSLQELITTYKADLLGNKVYANFGEKFPLLIKFIDAKKPLSIQLHPNDKLAKERHNSFGKTEMWYVMQADEKANLIIGFKEETTKEIYLKHLNNKTLIDILNIDEVKKRDVYFISPGRIHAIGAGVLLAEIQQTSDITYRIYDWDRPNSDGTYRDLHTEEAINVIDYSSKKNYKTDYSKEVNIASEIISCQYFTTNIIPLKGKINVKHHKKDSFVIYMCVQGSATFQYNQQDEKLNYGETILIPACIKDLTIISENSAGLLEIYIK